MSKKTTLKEFINKSIERFGDKYDFSKVNYINNNTKITITCPEHGDFSATPKVFLKSTVGCPECFKETKMNKDNFINFFIKKHGYRFDYSKSLYKKSNENITIICPEHGEFKTTPTNHLQTKSGGCPLCNPNYKPTTDEWIKIAKNINGNKYDYSKVIYENAHNPVTLICPEHGEFEITPHSHLRGCGCNICAIEKRADDATSTLDEFIKKAKEIHGDKYDYSKSVYVKSNIPLIITCPKHGDFSLQPNRHISSQNGCPKCSHVISRSETEIVNYIKEIVNDDCEIITNDRTVLKGKELDIYIPSKKIAIEFNGLYWHSEKKICNKISHVEKTNICADLGIRLIHIFEDEWIYQQDLCKSRLKNILGYNIKENKIYARKCIVKQLPHKDISQFLKENHMQGDLKSKYNYGLYYNDELVSVMTFGKLRKNLGSKHKENVYEMLRFCNKLNYNVIGAASKLQKAFINDYKPIEIISYADRRWSNGNLYEKLGYTFIKNTQPNYFYVIKNKRHNRFAFRKDVLISKYGCPKEMTEKEFCEKQGWYRIYDCGSKLFSYKPTY